MEIQLRLALKKELPWVNAQYAEIGFVASQFEQEKIAIAEIENVAAGLGRLVYINEAQAELGGIYTFFPYRGKGVAKRMVQYLLALSTAYQEIFCIPFTHFIHLYQKLGFAVPEPHCQIPKELQKKIQWCQKTYSQPVTLLVYQNPI